MTQIATRTQKPRAALPRTARLMDTSEGRLLRLQSGADTPNYYRLTELPSAWGRAFRVHKLVSGAEPYDVILDGRRSSCECWGHLRHGHCKHRESLTAQVKAGKL